MKTVKKTTKRASNRTANKAINKTTNKTIKKPTKRTGSKNAEVKKARGNYAKGYVKEPIRSDVLYGRNPVMEALKSGKQIEKIMLQEGARNSCGKILSLARYKGVRVDFTNKLLLDKMTGDAPHQGIICIVSQYEYAELDEVLESIRDRKVGDKGSVLVLLDEIEDPHNLGAIMRTAECSGADAVIIPQRRSVGLTETVAKTSAGAIEYMPCVRVGNMANTIDLLKEKGYWICGADMDGESLWSSKLTGNIAIVIGNEGKGISRLVREKCDYIVSIPMVGRIQSLNASNAAAVLLYEALRQNQ